jgi:hypothetical protein
MKKNRSKNLFLLNVVLVLSLSIMAVISKSQVSEAKMLLIVGMVCLLACCGSVYLNFSQACTTGDYTALAGFDSKKNYNYDVLAKMIILIQDLILWNTLIFNLILGMLFIFIGMGGMLLFILIIAYTIDLCVIIFGLNLKYKKQLFLK